ncbi:Zn-ribbon domain-containing OB-fold protein [uncultured Sphingomonas sp.]|uniref:Zn-ribbon domain-containing OB-fold protein n=1 Tax=uncultured Sphingomonas sp. TaxID=158754 RepID=UPI0035CAB286
MPEIEAIRPDRDAAPQWRSTRGALIIETCDDCAKPYYYPRGFCPICLGTNVRWVECSGRGTIYSYSITRRAEPYAIAYVELAEGPTILSNIVDSPLDWIAIGAPVSLVFRDIGGAAVPMFTLDGEQAA